MAAVSSNKSEVIELSDSDDLGGSIEVHVAPTESVRRSSRSRKASVRFSPDDEPSTSFPRVDVKSTKTSKSSKPTKKRPRMFESSDSEPDEFVLVDAVDYLRNLGYSDFEETETVDEDVKKEENMETSYFKTCQEVNFWDRLEDRQKLVGDNAQDSSDVQSSNSSESNVDVERVDMTAFNLRLGNLKKRKREKAQSSRQLNDSIRELHNNNERMRRTELATNFASLASVLGLGIGKFAKIRILEFARSTINDLRSNHITQTTELKELQKANQELKIQFEHVKKMQFSKRAATQKVNTNQEVKNFVNRLRL